MAKAMVTRIEEYNGLRAEIDGNERPDISVIHRAAECAEEIAEYLESIGAYDESAKKWLEGRDLRRLYLRRKAETKSPMPEEITDVKTLERNEGAKGRKEAMVKQGAADAEWIVNLIDRIFREELGGWFPVTKDFIVRNLEAVTNLVWDQYHDFYGYEYWIVSFFVDDIKYEFYADGDVELCTRIDTPLDFAQEILEFNGVSVGLDEMQLVEYTKDTDGCRCATVDAERNRYTVWEDGAYFRRPRPEREERPAIKSQEKNEKKEREKKAATQISPS